MIGLELQSQNRNKILFGEQAITVCHGATMRMPSLMSCKAAPVGSSPSGVIHLLLLLLSIHLALPLLLRRVSGLLLAHMALIIVVVLHGSRMILIPLIITDSLFLHPIAMRKGFSTKAPFELRYKACWQEAKPTRGSGNCAPLNLECVLYNVSRRAPNLGVCSDLHRFVVNQMAANRAPIHMNGDGAPNRASLSHANSSPSQPQPVAADEGGYGYSSRPPKPPRDSALQKLKKRNRALEDAMRIRETEHQQAGHHLELNPGKWHVITWGFLPISSGAARAPAL